MMKYYLGSFVITLFFVTTILPSCSTQQKPDTIDQVQKKQSTLPFPFSGFLAEDQIAEYIRHIFQDKNGHFWLGTNNYGVAHFDGEEISYFSYGQGFSGGQITGIAEDIDQNIWFATEQGVVKYDWSTTDDGVKVFTNFTNDDVLKGKRVWSIFADSKGDIWIGTNEGVIRFNGTRFESFELPFSKGEDVGGAITNRTIWTTTEDAEGNYWFGTNGNGTFKYDGNTFTQFTKLDGLADDSVDPILEDRQGNIWFGTRHGGISRYDGSTFVNFTERDSIGNNEVCIVFEDRMGSIWFSSEGHGVYRFDGKSLINYSEEQGLGVKAVQTIYEDTNDRLWVGGGGGLFRLDRSDPNPKNHNFINVTKSGPWN